MWISHLFDPVQAAFATRRGMAINRPTVGYARFA
jgi:hypothetical protein